MLVWVRAQLCNGSTLFFRTDQSCAKQRNANQSLVRTRYRGRTNAALSAQVRPWLCVTLWRVSASGALTSHMFAVCDVDGHTHQSGDSWFPDSCTSCTCRSGVVQCRVNQCPATSCRHPARVCVCVFANSKTGGIFASFVGVAWREELGGVCLQLTWFSTKCLCDVIFLSRLVLSGLSPPLTPLRLQTQAQLNPAKCFTSAHWSMGLVRRKSWNFLRTPSFARRPLSRPVCLLSLSMSLLDVYRSSGHVCAYAGSRWLFLKSNIISLRQTQGRCCPSCDMCEFEGRIFSSGKSFTHPSQPCKTCRCSVSLRLVSSENRGPLFAVCGHRVTWCSPSFYPYAFASPVARMMCVCNVLRSIDRFWKQFADDSSQTSVRRRQFADDSSQITGSSPRMTFCELSENQELAKAPLMTFSRYRQGSLKYQPSSYCSQQHELFAIQR